MPAGYAYDGRARIYVSEARIADPTAPTTVELAASIDLSGYGLPDGIAYNMGNSRVSGADLLSSFDAEAMGRFQAAPSLTFRSKLLTGETVAFDTFAERGNLWDLIVFEDIDEDADPVDGDSCFVFTQCQNGIPVLQNTAVNTERRFVVDFAVGGRPYLDAVVGGAGS